MPKQAAGGLQTLTAYKFDNPNKLADWLDEHGFFESGYLNALRPIPSPVNKIDKSVKSVSFQLLIMIGGSYDAGQRRVLSCYECSACGVRAWSLNNSDDQNCSFNGIEIESLEVNAESSIIDILVNDINLQCERLEISPSQDVRLLNRPFTNASSATVHLPDSSIPPPGQWINWLRKSGIEASWNYAYGEPRESDSLPQREYDGWFIKPRSCTNLEEHGLMFKTLVSNEYGCFIELDDWSNVPEESGCSLMWKSLSRAVAMFPGLTVRTGNCLLTGPEWAQSIEDGAEYLLALDFEQRAASGEPNGWYPWINDSDSGLPSRVQTPGGQVANFGMWPYVRKAD